MPFEKGIGSKIYKNVGRKGYEYEQETLTKMRDLLNKDLNIAKDIQSGELDETKLKKLNVLQARMLKIMDKLHASKTETEFSGEVEVRADESTLQAAKEFIEKWKASQPQKE